VKTAGVGELGRTGKATGGFSIGFRHYWVSWEGTGYDWKERIHSLTALEGGSCSTSAIGRGQEEEYFSGCSVARVSAPEGARCRPLWTSPRADAPRTGVYIISAWTVQRTGCTGRTRAQGVFFTDVIHIDFIFCIDYKPIAIEFDSIHIDLIYFIDYDPTTMDFDFIHVDFT